MVELTRIYTRGGDKGKTSLGDGKRVAKHDVRVEAYGTVDEANSLLGLARFQINETLKASCASAPDTDKALLEDMDNLLGRMQNDLFDLGADLCVPEQETYAYEPLRVQASQVEALESAIDRLNAELEPLKSFILPGGSGASTYLHMCRTCLRRAERQVSLLAETESFNPVVIKYLNRASDLMFVMARMANDKGKADVLWVPGANR